MNLAKYLFCLSMLLATDRAFMGVSETVKYIVFGAITVAYMLSPVVPAITWTKSTGNGNKESKDSK